MILSAVAQCPAQSAVDSNWGMGTVDPRKAQELYDYVWRSSQSPLTAGNETMPVSTEFYIKFKQLMELAPYNSFYYYSGYLYDQSTATSMYRRMLDSISDPAVRMMLVEDVMEHGKMYVDHLDSINVVRELNKGTKGKPLTMAMAKIKRAHYNFMYANNPKYYPQHLYDKKKVYELYREAFNEFLAAREEQGGDELEAYYVMEYYKACEDLYKSDEEKYYEQFLTDYQEIVQVCDKLLIPYYDIPDSVKNNASDPAYAQYQGYNYWTNASVNAGSKEDGIKARFAASGAANPERLSAYYEDRLNENRRDSAYLNKAISIMNENNCTQTEAFFSYCEASNVIAPTYLNCIGCAFASRAYKMRDEMIKYFLAAQKLATNDLQRGLIAYQIGCETNFPRPKDENGKNLGKDTPEYEEWTKNIMLSAANLKQVLQYQEAFSNSPSIAVRKIPATAAWQLGLAYYRMASMEQSSKECVQAITYIEMAMKASPQDYNTNARDMIDNINSVRAQYAEREAKINRNAKQRAELQRRYDEYMRKKKAEEDFWNQK